MGNTTAFHRFPTAIPSRQMRAISPALMNTMERCIGCRKAKKHSPHHVLGPWFSQITLICSVPAGTGDLQCPLEMSEHLQQTNDCSMKREALIKINK